MFILRLKDGSELGKQMAAEAQALSEWERVNGVKVYDDDAPLVVTQEEQEQTHKDKLWRKDPYYFKKCMISTVALLKMVMHAKQGEPLEIMGMLYGHTKGSTFVITDVVSLPVEGTETRVNASADCDAYTLEYLDFKNQTGYADSYCGWYHSHPSYKCWLSGIDVATEKLHQNVMDPWIAIVVDPVTTSTNGKVEIGAFRTFPDGFVPPQTAVEKKILPSDKVKDFGSFFNSYYTIKTEIFKTKLDDQVLRLLWHEYWITSLASTAIVSNREMMDKKVIDLYEKYQQEAKLAAMGSNRCPFESIRDDASRPPPTHPQFGDQNDQPARSQLPRAQKHPLQSAVQVIGGFSFFGDGCFKTSISFALRKSIITVLVFFFQRKQWSV